MEAYTADRVIDKRQNSVNLCITEKGGSIAMRPLKKIIFPAAGMGTRFLPATKANPKEMLTIVDKPLIQYAVEEAAEAGMDQVIIITGRGKRAIEDHFDASIPLENDLQKKGKMDLFEKVQAVSSLAEIAYVRQKQALGLGHAVLCADNWVHDEPFGVSLADELIVNDVPAMQQLRAVYNRVGCSVIGLLRVSDDQTHKYGIVECENDDGGLIRIVATIEKPESGTAPSNLTMVGRYIFTPALMRLLKDVAPGNGGEIQLTDAISLLLKEEKVYGVLLDGQRFDAGTPDGFLRANISLGLQNPVYGEGLRKAIVSHL